MLTFKYKNGYIHNNFTDNITEVQLGSDIYRVKNVQAAKILITKLMNQGV